MSKGRGGRGEPGRCSDDLLGSSVSYLQPALEAGLIEMTIPDKPRSSKQQDRLTERGRAGRDPNGGGSG